MYTAVAEEGNSGIERETAAVVFNLLLQRKIAAGSFLPQGSLLAVIKEDDSTRLLLAALGSEKCIVPWGDLDSLAMLQRQLDVDILVTGHTHQFKAYKHEGGVVINPGSATGAYSSITYDVNPSFVLMDIDGLRVVVYVYELIDGEVKVDKIDFKKTATTQSAH
ncbi:hypothetical protein GW17_00034136 [Ensete ventricosum]|nr:hypothetical protein GW17_00034136 [Ensete ventricosum]